MKKVLHHLFYSALLLLAMKPMAQAQSSLTGTIAPAAGLSIDLTAQGTLDWAHVGLTVGTDFNHKTGGNLIAPATPFVINGGDGPNQFGDSATSFSWSDGTPTASATNTVTGVFSGLGGFEFTAPAATTSRILKVYVGGFNSSGMLTAHLSDGSAPDYVNTDAGSSGIGNTDGAHFYVVYTLVFKAATAGKTLDIKWEQTAGGGNVTLQAATLAVTPTVVPAAPTGLAATAGDARAVLNWNAVGGADSYNIKRSTTPGGPYTTIGTAYSPGYQDTGLTNGTTYYYVVSAVNVVGQGANSNQASATPTAGIDGTGLKGEYYRAPDVPNPSFAPSLLILTQTDPTVNFNVDTALPPGVPHDNIAVRWSGTVKAQVSGKYIFTTASDDGIRLYVDGALVIDDYVYQGTTFRSSAPITLAAGSKHTIRILWFQGGGGGVAQLYWSYPGQTQQIIPAYALFPTYPAQTPAAPVLTGAPAFQSAILTWSQPENATAFNLKRSLTAGGPYTTIASNVTGGTYTDTGLTNGTTYYYVVDASNTFGTSTSNEVAVAPTSPVIGTGTGLGTLFYAGDDTAFAAEMTTPIAFSISPTVNFNDGNTVNYNPGPWLGAPVPHDHFTAVWSGQVQAPFTGPYTFQIIGDDGVRLTLDGNVIANGPFYQGPTTFTSGVINLTAGTKHDIKMEFFQGGGGRTAQLLYSVFAQPYTIIPATQLYATFTQAPDPVTNLSALGGPNNVSLFWSSPFYGLSYNVYRSLTAGGPYTQIATGITALTYVDSGLTNGTTYYYVVRAVNNIGTSGNSNEVAVKPANAVTGNGDGLYGTYYPGDDTAFAAESGTPFLYNIAQTINYQVDSLTYNPPDNPGPWPAGVPHDHYTVAWTGQLLAPFTADYSFRTNADDGIRLSLDSGAGLAILIDDPVYQAPAFSFSGTVHLTAGTKYPIRVDYFQGTGGALAQLHYSIQGSPYILIPQTQLFTAFTAAPPAPANLAAYAGSKLVQLTWSPSPTTASYTLKRSLTAGGPYTTLAAGLTKAAYTDNGLNNGTTYYYVVQAINAVGSSPNSNEASATPHPVTLLLRYNWENGPTGMDPDPIKDITNNGNNGSAFGGDVTFTHDAAEGVWAGLTTDATHYQALPDAFDFGNQFTVFTYAKLNDFFNIQTILGTNGSGGSTPGFALYVNDVNTIDHAIVFETNQNASGVNIQSKASTPINAFPLGDGKYHAVAVVVNRAGGTVSIYVDGVELVSSAIIDNTWPTASGANRLGEFPSGDQIAVGSQFDDFRVYNGLLSAADIAGLTGPAVSGKIALEGVNDLTALSAGAPLGTFHVSFRTVGTTTEVFGKDVTLTPSGAGNPNGTFTISGVPAGTYDIAIKGSKNLRVALGTFTISGALTLPDVILPAGDATNDNHSDIGDFGVMVNAYETTYDPNDPGNGYDAKADFNYDGRVNIGDFGLLVNEFGIDGAP